MGGRCDYTTSTSRLGDESNDHLRRWQRHAALVAIGYTIVLPSGRRPQRSAPAALSALGRDVALAPRVCSAASCLSWEPTCSLRYCGGAFGVRDFATKGFGAGMPGDYSTLVWMTACTTLRAGRVKSLAVQSMQQSLATSSATSARQASLPMGATLESQPVRLWRHRVRHCCCSCHHSGIVAVATPTFCMKPAWDYCSIPPHLKMGCWEGVTVRATNLKDRAGPISPRWVWVWEIGLGVLESFLGYAAVLPPYHTARAVSPQSLQ